MIPREHTLYKEPEQCTFYTSWCTDHEKAALEHALGEVTNKKSRYYEIGSFEGRSTVFIANLIAPKQLISIDPFAPHLNHEGELAQYKSRNIEKIFHHNIKVGTNNNVEANKMTWEDYFAANPKHKISFLYLDGPHTYENVTESLNALVPRMVKGGVMMGDDYDDASVKQAVDDFFGQEMTHPLSYRSFLYKS